jgi:hypothetical protein
MNTELKLRQDAAFYTNETGTELVWFDPQNPRFQVIRNGEMRIYYADDLINAPQHTAVIRYTDQLISAGLDTDEKLEDAAQLDETLFNWVNNPWFEVVDAHDPEYYSEPLFELDDAIGYAKELHEHYGIDEVVE